jgi:two-component system phosphate regulon sensor histidine kinase PhoR
LAETKQIALHWEKSASPVMARVDPDMITRAIRNLVDNAIKYTPAGGSVDVQALATDHSTVEIRVEDTGVGIAPEHQERIFDRFYRVDPSHTIPGAGLGLAIVQEIVRAHDGEVNVESTPGEGSTFIITLPG